MHQFDPSLVDNFGNILLHGDITAVTVRETPGIGRPNTVIDPGEKFFVQVEWEVYGAQLPLYLASLNDPWYVAAFAESLGAGPELKIGEKTVPKSDGMVCTVDPGEPHCTKWETEIEVPPDTLEEANPFTAADAPSGIYKLAVSVFLDSSLGEPGFDLIGYYEGPVIQAESTV